LQRQHPNDIAATINSIGPFDLMGFQESEAPAGLLDLVSKHSGRNYSFKQGGFPYRNISIAWNTKVFELVDHGALEWWMHYVKLKVIGSDNYIVMANTHGPVGQCRGPTDWKNVALGYIEVIGRPGAPHSAMQGTGPGDHMFMTGDFNCGATPSSAHSGHGHGLDDIIVEMRKDWKDLGAASNFKNVLYQPDRLWVMKNSDVKVKSINAQCCQRPGSCEVVPMKKDDPDDPAAPTCTAAPSDHMLLEAKVTVPLGSSQVQITV
jgi:hypothetical protein